MAKKLETVMLDRVLVRVWFTGHTARGGVGSTKYIELARQFKTELEAERCIRSCLDPARTTYELVFCTLEFTLQPREARPGPQPKE